ncbi:MAG TPA: translocation/assembly module TamB domain-containing protein, partial [Chitinophagaceae bacterium]|nr:translocation/assembly module TamB domain-containing protein [Chitinophagaceae bacterium]
HYIPERVSLKGVYKGTLQNMYTDLQLASSYGNASIKGTLKDISDKNKAAYNISARVKQLDLASILADTSLGFVNGSIALNGKGYDPKSMVSNFKLDIDSADYSGYTYRQVSIEGDIDHNVVNADIQSEDPNAELNGNITINLNEGSRSLKTNTHIARLDLKKLGFVADTLELRGDITADFPVLDTSGITGNLLASGTTINYQGSELYIDSLTIDARSHLDSQMLKIVAPYADIHMLGRYRFQDLPAAVQTVMNHYILTGSNRDTVFHKEVDAYLMAKFNIPDSVAIMIPGLKSIAPSQLIGKLNSSRNEIVFQARIPYVKYGDFEIDTLVAGITTYKTDGTHYENLKYVASINKLTGPSYTLEKSYIGGGAMKGIIDGSIVFMDENNTERYKFPYVFTNDPDRPNIVIPDSLVINEKKWFVNKDNRIYLDTKHLSGSKLTIGNNGTTLQLKTSEQNKDGLPMQLQINQFQIRDLAEIFISDTALARGTINGHLDISSLMPMRFTTDIKIDSLEILQSKLGNLRAMVEQQDQGIYTVNTTLKNDHNDVSLVGTYNTNEKQADLDLKITNLDLGDLHPITNKYLADLDGNLKGELSVKGSLDQPQIRGKINADSILVVYGMTGTLVRIPTSEFVFDENGIQFSELNITDSMGNAGKITGRVNSKDYRSFYADLAFNAKNFQIVGRRKMADQGIYGPTNADLNITIRGTQETMMIEGKVDVKDRSEFTYIYRSDVYDQVGEGLVEFFDPTKPVDTTTVEKRRKSRLGFQLLMNMYIHITPASSVTIVLDELSGDHLKAKGNADLNFIMRPGGGKDLIGTYLLDDGTYDLSIAGLVRKQFKIQKGSVINWSGDILKGRMDITAKYETKTAAGELVNDIDQIPGIDKQKLDFDVYIMLKDELLKPDISFRLDMDEEDQQAFNGIIYTRIKQVNSIPAELNKQVMGLLAFNQFIAENPFSSFTSSGGDF